MLLVLLICMVLDGNIGKGDRLPEASVQQAAVGSRGSGGTLNPSYSAEETLKASVSSEGRMNVLLWYRLVGAIAGLLSDWVFSTYFWPYVWAYVCVLEPGKCTAEFWPHVRGSVCPVRGQVFCPVRQRCFLPCEAEV